MEPFFVARLAEADRFASLNPHFPEAFAFLRRPDLAALPCGRHGIDGEACWATVAESGLRPFETAKPEVHRRYIDIQVPLSGPEDFGLALVTDPSAVEPFDAVKDIAFFEAPMTRVSVEPGSFAVFFPPTCGHAPCCRPEGSVATKIRKIIIKVRAEG